MSETPDPFFAEVEDLVAEAERAWADEARTQRLQAQMQSEAAEIGHSHGWDAANYGYAYGSDREETVTEQAARRAKERYPDGTQVRFLGAVRQEYREAFLAGHAAFHADLNEAFGPEED